jgi:nitroreductase
MELLDLLTWRYATKRMNGNTVPNEKLERILESIRFSASSIGLQPYTILVVQNPEIRKQLQPIINNQAQVTECSHLLIFATWDKLTPERIESFLADIESARGKSERTESLKKSLYNRANSLSEQDQYNWMARQAYIALGTGLIAAACEQVDATPMEGFNNAQLDEFLKLREQGLRSVALLALGYRDEMNDYLVKLPKVRRAKEKLFIRI